MDPTHKKLTTGHRATQPPTNRQIHFCKRTLALFEHHAYPQQNASGFSFKARTRIFPFFAKVAKKIMAAGKDATDPVMQKAVDHALKRLAEGKSVFAD
jgi:hypothetical protein